MSRNLLLTCAAILAVVIAVTFFLTVPQGWTKEESTARSAEDLPKENTEYDYELKTYDGKLAVYFYGEKQPRRVFDVYIQTLPEWDQEQLKTGVPVKDYEELLKRIEDYSS